MSLVNRLIGKYVDTNKAEAALESNNVEAVQQRILVILAGVGEDMFSGYVSEQLKYFNLDDWVIESLHPVLVLSSDYNKKSLLKTGKIVSTVSGLKDVRVAAALAEVKYGLIGSGNRMSYGSMGVALTNLIEAIVRHQNVKVLISSALSKDLKYNFSDEPISVNQEKFVSLR